MGGGQIEVVTKTIFVEDEIRRPADTTQYAAGDVISETIARTLWFARAARSNGGGGVIQSCFVIDSTAETTKPDLELYLFNANIVIQADNAAWAPTDLAMEAFVGWISLSALTFKTCGGNGVIQTTDKGLAFVCAPTSRDLFGVLLARNTYTPISGELIRVKMGILAD